jgi:two-component system alkaline phosphatase synthesis response regulator PhoP
MKDKILCIDDDLSLQTLVQAALSDFEILCAQGYSEALRIIDSNFKLSALLVDIQLPDGDGLELLSRICVHKELSKLPVIILSGQTALSNKVTAFTFGADDFISKPFDPIELKLRVTSKIKKRRQDMDSLNERRFGNLLIDVDRHKVFAIHGNREKDLHLTSTEWKILMLLTRRVEVVFSRDQILESVWGDTFISDRTVDSHIAHLRTKLERTDLAIESVRNLGYRAIDRHS